MSRKIFPWFEDPRIGDRLVGTGILTQDARRAGIHQRETRDLRRHRSLLVASKRNAGQLIPDVAASRPFISLSLLARLQRDVLEVCQAERQRLHTDLIFFGKLIEKITISKQIKFFSIQFLSQENCRHEQFGRE